MNIELYPQCQLLKFTILLNYSKGNFITSKIESRAVDGTIINRAYYSAYSLAKLWLENHDFKIKDKMTYEILGEKFKTEHKQVADGLKEYGFKKCGQYLYDLHELRKKADYNPYVPLTTDDLEKAIFYMNSIIKDLDFNSMK